MNESLQIYKHKIKNLRMPSHKSINHDNKKLNLINPKINLYIILEVIIKLAIMNLNKVNTNIQSLNILN